MFLLLPKQVYFLEENELVPLEFEYCAPIFYLPRNFYHIQKISFYSQIIAAAKFLFSLLCPVVSVKIGNKIKNYSKKKKVFVKTVLGVR